MRVLVACEFSGVVRDAFLAKGHDAISCDLEESERPGPHYRGDVRDLLKGGFDLMIAFPPCTHLSKAGAHVWKHKAVEQREALDFVWELMTADIPKIAIENPAGKINTAIGKPSQIVHPWMFGHPWTKQTCLWLKGLPYLQPTNVVEPVANWVKPGNKRPWRKFDAVPEGGNRNAVDRSRTFPGIAAAMAEQWSGIG